MKAKLVKESIEDKVIWKATKESFDKILDLGLTYKDWKPGEMGTNIFYIKVNEDWEVVELGDIVYRDKSGNINIKRNIKI